MSKQWIVSAISAVWTTRCSFNSETRTLGWFVSAIDPHRIRFLKAFQQVGWIGRVHKRTLVSTSEQTWSSNRDRSECSPFLGVARRGWSVECFIFFEGAVRYNYKAAVIAGRAREVVQQNADLVALSAFLWILGAILGYSWFVEQRDYID